MKKSMLIAVFSLLLFASFTWFVSAESSIKCSLDSDCIVYEEMQPGFCSEGKICYTFTSWKCLSSGYCNYTRNLRCDDCPNGCLDEECIQNTTDCKNLWYYDNEHQYCQQKQFCGTYMYLGLHTFESREQCERVLNNTDDKFYCQEDEDCTIIHKDRASDCCPPCVKENYSLGEYISVSVVWLANQRSCSDVACALCLMEVNFDNDKWISRCVNNECKKINSEQQVYCAKEAKPCPNGRVVSRNSSNNCEFDKCTLSNGRKVEIKVMPETASARAIERLGELGFNITLKEVGNGNETRAVYELTAEKDAKLFGFIKKKAKIEVDVDAENNGEIISVKRPWWSFMASGI